MSKLSLEEKPTYDSYLEHDNFHQEYHLDCSSCHSERRATQRTRLNTASKYPELSNPYGSNYPVGINPNYL